MDAALRVGIGARVDDPEGIFPASGIREFYTATAPGFLRLEKSQGKGQNSQRAEVGMGLDLSRIWGKENHPQDKGKEFQPGKVGECRKRGKSSKAELDC